MTYEGKLRAAINDIATLNKFVHGTSADLGWLQSTCEYYSNTNYTDVSKYALEEKNKLNLWTIGGKLLGMSSFRVTDLTQDQLLNFNPSMVSTKYQIPVAKDGMMQLIGDCTKLQTWNNTGKVRMPGDMLKATMKRDYDISLTVIKTPIRSIISAVGNNVTSLIESLNGNIGSVPDDAKGIVRALSLQLMIAITLDRCIEILCWIWDYSEFNCKNVAVKEFHDIRTVRVDVENVSKYYATKLADVIKNVKLLLPGGETPGTKDPVPFDSDVIGRDGHAKNLPELISIMIPFNISNGGLSYSTHPRAYATPESYFMYKQYLQEHISQLMDIENYFSSISPKETLMLFDVLLSRSMMWFSDEFNSMQTYPNSTSVFDHSTLTHEQTIKDWFGLYADTVVSLWNKWIAFGLTVPMINNSYKMKMSVNNILDQTKEVLHGKKIDDAEALVVENLTESVNEYYSKIDAKLHEIKTLCEAYGLDPNNLPESILEDVTKIAPKAGNYGKGVKAFFKKVIDFFRTWLINSITSFTSTIEGAKKGVEWCKANKQKLLDTVNNFSKEDEVTSKPYNYKAPFDRLLSLDTLSKNILTNVKDTTAKINETANKISNTSTADEIATAEKGIPDVSATSIGKEIQKSYPEAVNQDLTFDANVLKSFILFGKTNKDEVRDQTFVGDACKQRYSDAIGFLTDEKIQALINAVDYNAFKTDSIALTNALKAFSDKKDAALKQETKSEQKPEETKSATNNTDNPPPADKQPEQKPADNAPKQESMFIIDRFNAIMEADDVKINPDQNASASNTQAGDGLEQRIAEYLRAVEKLLKTTFECLQDSYVDAYNFVTMYYKILKNRQPATQPATDAQTNTQQPANNQTAQK